MNVEMMRSEPSQKCRTLGHNPTILAAEIERQPSNSIFLPPVTKIGVPFNDLSNCAPRRRNPIYLLLPFVFRHWRSLACLQPLFILSGSRVLTSRSISLDYGPFSSFPNGSAITSYARHFIWRLSVAQRLT